MTSLRTRLLGLAATLALLAFMAGVPAALLAMDAVPDLDAFSWSRLTAPDDGTLAMEVITAVCWIAWAVFTCQLLVSIVSQLRGMRVPRLPGLAMPQIAADRLVAAAALLFVAVPSTAALFPQTSAEAVVSTAPLAEPPNAAAAPAVAGHVHTVVEAKAEPETERYTVKRGDSLWKIAEERLGDGTRYVELVVLNQAVLDGHPDFLLPGTVLKVPIVDTSPAGAYVVQPGDTLSEIAEDELGNADAYPSIFEASRDTVQANGAHLTDPDLILPGWKLTLPGGAKSEDSTKAKHAGPTDTHPDGEEALPDVERPTPTAGSNPTARPGDVGVDDGSNDTSAPAWLLPGLTGAGAALGGAFWLVLRAQRRTQLRYRRPGTIISPPPPELVPLEKTAHAMASVIAPRIEDLDAALRSLAPAPRLITAELSETSVTIRLAKAVDLPAPWTGSTTEWRIALTDVPARPDDSFPPYPLLVSVGRDAAGSFLFLNLEELRTVTVTGDLARKSAFARHLAAELAVNPWSIVTTVDLLGLGSDLASFNLGRVRTHPAGDTAFITQLTRVLGSIEPPYNPDDFHAAIIATASRPESELTALADLIEGLAGRSSAALVDLAGEPRTAGTELQLTADGRLQAANLGVDVVAAGLSEEEARACALLLDLTIEERVVPVQQSDGPGTMSDRAGALAAHLTEPRPPDAAGDSSLLPLDAHAYADAAAATVEDVEMLAPRAIPEARTTVESADPDLDEDLARWESPTLSAAKLTLLGPVGARTTGDSKSTAHRRPFYVELLAYLVLHPQGAAGVDIAKAFGLRPERVRVDISQLRRWLGTNPHSGQPYLPNAQTPTDPDSPAVYKLHGVLCDLDLFRRLRARGQSRGADGIDDLVAALRLVSGEPFSDLRKDHWNWLLEGDRWDHIMTSAIVDVGHIVTTHALANGDSDLALWAAQAAYAAAPYDEVAQLDMVAAEKAAGDDQSADRDLDEKVLNRRDDDLPPIDLPPRTAKIINHQKWDSSRSRRAG